jgi:uncharacterized protein YggE
MTQLARFATILLLSIGSSVALAQSDAPKTSVAVVGMGQVSAIPDTAQVNVGVVSEAATASEAMQKNNAAMQRLLQTLKNRGIPDKDVQTRSFNVMPQYSRGEEKQPPRLVGYQVVNQVEVVVRKIDDLGGILDDLLRGGANKVDSIRFDVAKPESLLDEARRLAMANAHHKAALYAQAAGLELGNATHVQEQRAAIPAPQPRMALLSAERAVPIAPGELTFQAEVSVTYSARAK